MLKIVAPTLEEAYKKASQAYDCSIVDLDIEVIQAPSRGVLGLFKKDAIINAGTKTKKIRHRRSETRPRSLHRLRSRAATGYSHRYAKGSKS